MTRERLIEAVQAEFDRVKAELEPRLLEKARRGEAAFADPELRNIQVAQNVLRLCMEAAFQRLLPYSHQTSVEMALRLASYALSTAPIEDQEILVAQLLNSFASAHERRMALGVRISAEWQMKDGRTLPNFPSERGSG